MIGYIFALLPFYIFIYLPLSQLLFPSSSSSPSRPSSPSDHEHTFNASFVALEDPDLVCPDHTYSTHILSREPLVLYLENWLSNDEITHLLEIRSLHPPHPPSLLLLTPFPTPSPSAEH
jgi:prolyl 4-hydroxylase